MRVEKNGVFYEVTDGYEWFWPGFASGDWEPNTFKVFDKFLTPGSVYVDIGAWIGPTVLYAVDKCAKVLAFEPDPVAFRELELNIIGNNYHSVVPYPVAVSSFWRTMQFGPKHDKFGDSMASEIWGGKGYRDVPAVSLRSVIEGNNPDFIKIDIEGGEKFLFEDSAYLFTRYEPTIYLSLHTPWFKENQESYIDAIEKGLCEFPYFYDEHFHPIRLRDAFRQDYFTTVIASFKKL